MISPCPVCLSADTRAEYHIAKFKPSFKLARCKNCGSLFQSPMPKNANAYYGKDYYTGKAQFSYIDERKNYDSAVHVYKARLKAIRRYFKKPHQHVKFLDVGCSFGGGVLAASKYFNAAGIDVSSFAINEGQKWVQEKYPHAPVSLFQGDLLHTPDDSFFAPESIDVITMIEVAEHLETPRKSFQKAFQLLKPNGLLVIQTANISGWQAVKAGSNYHYYLPGHLVCYSGEGLKKMLLDLGFTRFKEFFPVDFSLIAKLKKSKGGFTTFKDYLRWVTISWYHVKGKFHWRGRPLTSSYVLYAFK